MSSLPLETDQRELYGDVDLSQLFLRHGPERELDIATFIVSADVTRTIDGASTLPIVVSDRDRSMLRSGLLEETIDVRVDDLWFRLAASNKQADQLTLTFEARAVAILRTYDSARKARRGEMTRAEFARMLVREARPRIPFVSPELHVRQPIQKQKQTQKDARRQQGLADDAEITVKGERATKQQRRNIEAVLDVGVGMEAPKKVLIASVVTITQEADALNPAGGDRDSVGIFQQRRSQGWPATRVIATDAAEFFKRAIAENKKHPGLSVGQLAQNVQHSAPGAPSYQQWKDEAERTVNAYGAGGTSVVTEKPYEFTRGVNGQKEDTWTCLGRLADEVNWRRFEVSGAVYFISDDQLMRSRVRARVSEASDGIDSIDFDWDPGKKAQTARIVCRIGRWQAPPGSVVELVDMGPADGRWLVQSARRSLFRSSGEIQLTRARPKRREPAPETVSHDFSGDGPTTLRQAIVAAAEQALAFGSYPYRQARPMHSDLFSKAAQREGMDCSEFVTLVFKAAGAEDPNRSDYNGSGNTSTLWAHGGKVSSPKPGDLVFYDKPSGPHAHVAVWVGKGKVISQGGPAAGPHEPKGDYRAVYGFRTYLDD